jgi:lysophospholipase L1-like esterase
VPRRRAGLPKLRHGTMVITFPVRVRSEGFLVAALVALAFAYGVGVGRYEWFPFHLIAALRGLAPFAHTPLQQSRLSIFRNTPGAFEFVMLGDSITADGNWSELIPTARIANRGIDGNTSADILSRIDEIIERRPKIVFLMIGINDLIRNAQPSEITANVQRVISALAEHDIPTVVQITLLTDKSHKLLNEKVIELDQALQRLCAQNNVKFLDLNSILSDGDALNPRFTWDGIHLSGDAYVRWAHEIRPIIDLTQRR